MVPMFMWGSARENLPLSTAYPRAADQREAEELGQRRDGRAAARVRRAERSAGWGRAERETGGKRRGVSEDRAGSQRRDERDWAGWATRFGAAARTAARHNMTKDERGRGWKRVGGERERSKPRAALGTWQEKKVRAGSETPPPQGQLLGGPNVGSCPLSESLLGTLDAWGSLDPATAPRESGARTATLAAPRAATRKEDGP